MVSYYSVQPKVPSLQELRQSGAWNFSKMLSAHLARNGYSTTRLDSEWGKVKTVRKRSGTLS